MKECTFPGSVQHAKKPKVMNLYHTFVATWKMEGTFIYRVCHQSERGSRQISITSSGIRVNNALTMKTNGQKQIEQ